MRLEASSAVEKFNNYFSKSADFYTHSKNDYAYRFL